jgi:hypothetical protein
MPTYRTILFPRIAGFDIGTKDGVYDVMSEFCVDFATALLRGAGRFGKGKEVGEDEVVHIDPDG